MKRSAAATAALLALSVAACSDGGSPTVEEGAGGTATTAAPAAETTLAEEATTTTAAAVEPLTILVSNDDGYAADGIGALVEALEAQPDVEVVVVAPDGNRSGSGGQTSEGFTAADVTMPDGHPAVAVTGFPADAVTHGLDVLGVDADLVITGTNEGQNLGPFVDISGTVGAARVAAQRGIPAVAVSTGLGTPAPDHAAAVAAAIDWFVEHRGDLEGATQDQVVNINVPTCAVGEVRGVVEVTTSTADAGADALAGDVDCSGTGAAPGDDVAAFNAGFAVVALVPAAPA
jgi:5'-nucleotidase